MIRKARIADVIEIHKMLWHFAETGKLLARSLSELYTTVRDMVVFEDEYGCVAGCCTLHIVSEDLAEIRSLAVLESHQHRGIGRGLVEACMSEAKQLGIGRIFTLTDEVGFFERLGFQLVDKDVLPHKVWWDCSKCPKHPDYCDESALVLDLPG
ncbi:MAG: N-acetyltransferase [Syntrophobacteraceae bacterium]|jgi:amino-acid N-acetyltransferase